VLIKIRNMLKKIITCCKDSYEELIYKTTWPSRPELTKSAIAVLVASIVIALVVFAEDTVFESLMKFVYGV
jgi:preprotein translocase subunit SecE